ncbi:hypothetical protein Tco_1345464 [Tanacetum coccineum]
MLCKQEEDISVGLILNGLTKDFVGFVRNYNMHNMGKTIGEIHAMLIEYEKGLPKKAETPQLRMNDHDHTVEEGRHWKRTVLCIFALAEFAKERGSKLALPVLRDLGLERKLKQGALNLYDGRNGVRAQV